MVEGGEHGRGQGAEEEGVAGQLQGAEGGGSGDQGRI